MTNKTLYRVYSIDKYSGKTNNFINNSYKEYTLDNLIKELENDKGYHMRISCKDNYIFFGDCDGFDGSFDKFAKLLMNFLRQHYKIEINTVDISYTENEAKIGSYHYSIPEIYAKCEKLKEIHENFFNKHKDIFSKRINNKTTGVIDTTIYSNKWFRYPNQSKESDNTVKHIIKWGKMIDFIVEYIPENSVCIDKKLYISLEIDDTIDESDKNSTKKLSNLFKQSVNKISNVTKNKKSNATNKMTQSKAQTRSRQILSVSNSDNIIRDDEVDDRKTYDMQQIKGSMSSTFKREFLDQILSSICGYDDFNEWTNVGMALKNESSSNDSYEFFDLWDKWSKKSTTKYDGRDVCRKKWQSFKKMNGGYSMQYLLSLLKIYDTDKFNSIQKLMSMQKFFKENGRHYPNNECILDKIESSDQSHNLIIMDEHCPIYNNEHSDKCDALCHRFFEISNRGTACMKCTNKKCLGRICPENGITVPKKIIKKIFILNHNDNSINVTNNNNYGNNKSVYDVQHYIMCVSGKNSKIYDDDILNELMIKTLNESDDVIASAIEYIYKDKICFVDKMWYHFNGVIWKECDINNNVIAKFVALYEQIKQFITKATDIFEVVKHEYREQLNDIICNIKNMKNNKHIIAILEDKFLTKNIFDLNMNIFAFDNGVYDFEQMEFRQTTSTDMVMTTCGYNYDDKYVNKQSLINVMQNIFPNNMMDFFFGIYCKFVVWKKRF